MDIYKLLSRKQQPEETFENFYADLKRLIRPCKFGEQEDKLMKALIALGVRSRDMQQKLLREDTTIDKVVSFCKSFELADRNMNLLYKRVQGDVDMVKQRSFTAVQDKSNGDVDIIRQSSPTAKSYQTSFSNKPLSSHYGKNNRKCCFRCGKEHSGLCPALGKTCSYCSKPNHFANMCRLRNSQQPNKVSCLEHKNYSDESIELSSFGDNKINSLYIVNSIGKKTVWCKEVCVNGNRIKFKLDSGADVNILPLHMLQKLGISHKSLEKCKIQLEAYGGFKIKPIGSITLQIETDSKISLARFLIVNNQTAIPILGLESCIDLNLIKRVDTVNENNTKSNVDKDKQLIYLKHKDVFNGLGCFPDICRIKLKENATPSISPARRIPFKIKDKFRETLESLKLKGIITPVEEPVDWINNVVVVEKPDGSLRICIDPIELNKYIIRERYVIPTIEELSQNLSHKKVFTVLDIKDAFYHIALDDESSKLCSFSTVFGTFRFLRAPFGLSCLPELFQRLVHKYFGDIKGVSLYFDDLCIASDSKEENDKILQEILERAKQFNVKFNFSKFQYCLSQVKYVGVIFCEKGMLPDPDKIETIKNLESPKTKQDLQRILGMVNYLRHFVPNMSDLVSPLRTLLRKDVAWQWSDTHDHVFHKLKQVLCSPQVLASFDPTLPIEIQCDASKDSLGFCMLQKRKPLYFGSRSMTTTEESYAQVEKELLAVCYAVKKLHNYIYGHNSVTIFTDHLPLVSIISKPMDKILNNRLKRLKLKLIDYSLNLKYLPGKYMFIADYMSRTGLKTVTEDDQTMKDFIHTLGSADVPLSEPMLKRIQEKTKEDNILKDVISYLHEGWPDMNYAKGEMKHMYRVRNELQFSNGLLYLGTRLIVPQSLRRLVLSLLHETHLGSAKINSLVDQFYYWPGIYSDVHNLVTSCAVCQKYSRSNIKEPLINHKIPSTPFTKIGADIAEINGLNFLVVIDYFSRWLEVYQLNNKNSSTIIKKFKETFSRFGIPQILIADNMPFNSFEMRQFAKEWNFAINTSSPYYPKSNGLAERAVGIFKNMIKKANENKQDLELYLMNYRNTPVAGLGYSPSQLLNSRHLRTKLPIHEEFLKPNLVPEEIINKMEENQRLQKFYYDRNATESQEEFIVGQDVLAQNVRTKQWEPFKVIEKLPQPRSYLIQNNKGSVQRRNSIHLRKYKRSDGRLISQREDETRSRKSIQTQIITPTQTCSRSGRILKAPAKMNL